MVESLLPNGRHAEPIIQRLPTSFHDLPAPPRRSTSRWRATHALADRTVQCIRSGSQLPSATDLDAQYAEQTDRVVDWSGTTGEHAAPTTLDRGRTR
jgi:hypothetical protein